MTSSTVPNRLTGAVRTGLTVVAVLFLLKVALYLDIFREGFMWPFRILTVAAALWLLYAAVHFVRTTKFELKKVVFSLILGLMLYGALHLICAAFIKLMSVKDGRLLTIETTELSGKARAGIQVMLDGRSPVQYDREIGWVHRPGYQWNGHSITEQGLRGARIYPVPPPDPAKRFLCLGDSFTFGYEVGDDHCYPAQGEDLLPGTEWINLGLCGGDLTQALLQYRKAGREFGGKYVVIGFMTNNQMRTVNCFRAFVAPGGMMTPLTKPYAKWSDGRMTIEPNPFQDISDYEKLLADEAPVLARLRELDYITWSGQQGSTNPIIRTLDYIRENREVDANLSRLLKQDRDHGPRLSDFNDDPYGKALWHPESPAFKANAGVFDLFHQDVLADGRVPLIVIIPSAQDVENAAKGKESEHAALNDHLEGKGYLFFDFLESLRRRYPDELTKDKFFVATHLNAETNKFLAEEIIKALGLR